MENQTNQVATVGPNLRPLKIGDNVSTLKACLKMQMLKVGIRPANLPDEEEKLLLINFVLKHFSNYTIAQVDEAFDLAILGRLPIQDAGHYENFSCGYFGKIMAAYKSYLINEGLIKKNTDRERQYIEPERQIESGMADWGPHFEEIKAKVLAGEEPFFFPSNIYDWMASAGIIETNAYLSHMEAAKTVVRGRLLEDRQEASYGAKNAINESLEQLQNASQNALVICEAKRMAVIEYCKIN